MTSECLYSKWCGNLGTSSFVRNKNDIRCEGWTGGKNWIQVICIWDGNVRVQYCMLLNTYIWVDRDHMHWVDVIILGLDEVCNINRLVCNNNHSNIHRWLLEFEIAFINCSIGCELIGIIYVSLPDGGFNFHSITSDIHIFFSPSIWNHQVVFDADFDTKFM